MIKSLVWTLTILFSSSAFSASDTVDWEALGPQWRKLICLKEAVLPMSIERAKLLSKQLEVNIKEKYEARTIRSLSYRKQQPEPAVIDEMINALVVNALAGARNKNGRKKNLESFRKLASASFDVCSRVLYKFPEVKCHGFLMVRIRAGEFFDLVESHFDEYKSSSIYLLDMKNQCGQLKAGVGFGVDDSCLPLAEEYFEKNYLAQCKNSQFEKPDASQFVSKVKDWIKIQKQTATNP